MTNTKSKHLLAVAALLAAALAMMLFYTTQKQGYHVDELYTYELTNYPGSFYALSDGYMDTCTTAVFTPGFSLRAAPQITASLGTTKKPTSTRHSTTA